MTSRAVFGGQQRAWRGRAGGAGREMKLVGLTGGIASGKSAVTRLLREAGVPVVDCDDIAHDVVKKVVLAHVGSALGARGRRSGGPPGGCRE